MVIDKKKCNSWNRSLKNLISKLTGALIGNVAVPIDIKPFNTLVKASISKSVGVPKCTVLVVSTVNKLFNYYLHIGWVTAFRPVVPSQYCPPESIK